MRLHLDGVTTEGLEAVYSETKLPILLGDRGSRKKQVNFAYNETEPFFDKQFLDTHRVRIGGRGNLTFKIAVKAVYDALKALRDGQSPDDLLPTMASNELQAQVTHVSEYNEWLKNFLGLELPN